MYGKYVGRVVYDPPRLKNQSVEFKKQHKTKTCILQMPYDNISQFYQWFLLKQYGLHVQNPLFQNHVTIVGGNESRIVTPEYGKLLKNQELTFRLATQKIHKVHQFWVIPVIDFTGQLMDLRTKLLGKEKPINFHLTIGREYEADKYPSFGFEPCLSYSQLTNGITK